MGLPPLGRLVPGHVRNHAWLVAIAMTFMGMPGALGASPAVTVISTSISPSPTKMLNVSPTAASSRQGVGEGAHAGVHIQREDVIRVDHHAPHFAVGGIDLHHTGHIVREVG